MVGSDFPKTLIQALRQRAEAEPERAALRFVTDDDLGGGAINFGELDARARAIAVALQEKTEPGDRAVLLFPTGLDYVTAFLGCLYAGVIAVPAYPPESTRHQHQQRLLSIIADAEPSLLLTNTQLFEPLSQAMAVIGANMPAGALPGLFSTDSVGLEQAESWQMPDIGPDHIAFLQYTSGSTSMPKGVQVTHHNLVENEALIRHGFGITDEDVIVSWLPLYHDMGLIGCLLQSVYSGVLCVLMSPRFFLERPVRWLRVVSHFGGTISGGPDFAYRLCSERVSESDLAALDLSSWQIAFSGSEPIRDDTLAGFAEKFSPCGFKAERFFSCYGLAEATLFVTGGLRQQGITALQVDGESLAQNIAKPGDDSVVMGCGFAQPDHGVRIVDPVSLEDLAENAVGEIWATGPSIANGYWRNPEATAKAFVEQDGQVWLRTGDLGFMRDNEMFVTGRLKDMLIVRGQNLYPQDLERTVEEEVEVVRKGRVAAYATNFDGMEGIGIAAEVSKKLQKLVPPNMLINAIREAVANIYQEVPQQVALLNPGTLPKTSSGKLQRSACRKGIADGSIEAYALFPEVETPPVKQEEALVKPEGQKKASADSAPTSDSNDSSTAEQTQAAGADKNAELTRGIAKIWRELLNCEQVADTDHFLLLGGNSVLAVQLVARISEHFSIEVPLRLLFEAPKLAEFTAAVIALRDNGAVQKTEDDSSTLVMSVQSRDKGLPLSPAQNRLWFQWQLEPQSVAYNIPAGLRLKGALNKAAIQDSFQYLVNRHEGLRTRFAEQNGEVLQFIAAPDSAESQIEVEQVDLTTLPVAEREAEAGRLREQAGQAVFDLSAGNLLRIKLVALDDEDHLLLVTLHHIIADGWSLNLMMDEFSRLYVAADQGIKPSQVLQPLSLHYADFAAWQCEWLNQGEAEPQLEYWTQQLAGEQPVLNLPKDHLPVQTPIQGGEARQRSAARLSVDVDAELTQVLHSVANTQGATLFMVLLAAFQCLLYRYSGQKDIRIGVPSANRDHPDVQGMVGFFINTLVLRGEINAGGTFAQLLTQARQITLDAQANQDLPIDRLVEAIASSQANQGGSEITRPGESPLFQVMFNHQQMSFGTMRELSGVAVEELPWHSREAKFDLQLQSEEDERGRLTLNVDYAEDTFKRDTIEQLTQRFVALLRGIAQDPEQNIATMALLSDAEQQQMQQWEEATLVPASESPAALLSTEQRAEQLLPQRLEQQAKLSPEAIALLWSSQSSTGEMSFDELNRRANRLAHELQARGIGPEVRVAILAERSPQLMVGLLAILKAGGAYVPLDPDYPAERLAHILDDSAAELVLADNNHQQHTVFENAAYQQCLVAMEQLALDSQPDTTPELKLHANNLAYVIYTSGSTGLPKGVGISHGALSERLRWMQSAYQFDAQDVLLQKAPVSFDASVWELFLPLITGSRLVLAAPGEHRDPQRLVALVQQYGVTAIHFVPPLLQLFIEEPGVEQCSSLRYLFSGGEALSPSLRDRVIAQLPDVALHNRYGPTETAINVTHWHCQAEDESRSPIGQPLGNVICRVLGSELESVPAGVAGELCVGGEGLTRGYISRRPEVEQAEASDKRRWGWAAMTAERFIPDPSSSDEGQKQGARLYRTGDQVRWGSDGALDYLGRIDQQIKLRGFRIELQEIEAQLLASPQVKQAAVTVFAGTEEAPLPEQLIAYYVPVSVSVSANQDAVDEIALKQTLQQTLPEYMVPSQFIALEVMPVTAAGKVNYRALPTPADTGSTAVEYVAPVTPLQQQVAEIWQDVMAVSQIGLKDDFFERGGHSLLATQIVSRTRLVCNVELPLKALFEHSQLEAFVEQVSLAQAEGRLNSMPDIEMIDRDQPVPLSYSQQRYWFLWQMEPDSPAYNVGGMARLRGDLQLEFFEAALQGVIQRHEALRTLFPSIDGVPVQQVALESDVELKHLDFTSLSGDRLQDRIQLLADHEAHEPFDLEHGPLMRACLVKADEQEHYLVLTLHHIVTEGWAMDIFARELSALYAASVAKGAIVGVGTDANVGADVEGSVQADSPLEALPVQYLDYSVWQRNWMESGEGQRQLDYWTAKLGGEQPVLELPSDRPRPPVQSHQGGLYRFDLSQQQADQVRSFNADQGLTQFMTMTAALAVLLYRYSGQEDLRIGAPVANRIRPESEGLIGAFLNTQVLRCQLDGQMSVANLLEQVRTTVIEGQSHQDLPFDQLVDVLQPPRSTAYNPLFQVMCNVQRWDFQQSRELAGLQVDYIVNDAEATKFDLNLEVTDLNDQLSCCLTYSTDLFDEDRIERMAGHWRNLLIAMVENPEQKVCELPLFSDSEQHSLLSRLHSHYAAPVQDENAAPLCVHEVFAQRAADAPDAPALTFAGETLSYGELDRRANQLAHWLREQGVAPETSVGLAMERSLEMVIGLLAILKAGGAYVPLDPEYPLERLQGMIEDSGICLLLGHNALFETLGELPAGVKAWCVEDDGPQLVNYSDQALSVVNHPDHQAYLIYTSGSTGKPKGVMVSHGEISRHCQAVIERFGMRSDDCELHFYSINFDAATERLLTPLLCGGRVVLRAQGQWGAEEICQIIREQSVNTLGCTPGYGSQLAQWQMSRGETLPIRMCITGGEALTAEHLQRIRAAFQPEHFFNAYGPTETVVMPLASAAPEQLDETAASVPIGDVVGSRVAYILDDDLALVPQGGVGELYVGGDGLARGYHLRAGLTAERFIPDPYTATVSADSEAGRLYRTGDLVRQRPDGQVEYMGRSDYQVKVRGFRIELGEIEARMLEHDGVDEVVVAAVEMTGGKQLVGYIAAAQVFAGSLSEGGLSEEARSGEALSEEESNAQQEQLRESLKAQLKAQLPDYMVPAHLILMPVFPLSPNGKVDRKALPVPAPESNRQAYQAPGTEWEQALADIWCDVLGVERVGIHDNFFELGGDSILSIQVVSRARQLGIHFTPRELFQHQTVQTLAAAAKSQPTEGEEGGEAFIAEQGPITGESLLTPIQHWFTELQVPNAAHWNQSLLLEPTEALDADTLNLALEQLITQHDALRLRFQQTNDLSDSDQRQAQALDSQGLANGLGQWQAQHADIAESTQSLLQVLSVEQPGDALEHFEAAQRSLDLQHGPLLRAVLVTAADNSQRLLLMAHHLVVDGVSWRILLGDLQQAYRQLKMGETVQLAAKTSAFRDWTAKLQAYAKSESLRETLAWWQQQLGPDQEKLGQNQEKLGQDQEGSTGLPCDRPEGENLERHAETVRIELDSERTRQLLQQAPAAYRTQVNDLLLTALSRVLCGWAQTDSVLVQLEGHGREEIFADIDLTRTVGWFTSAYPMRLTPALAEQNGKLAEDAQMANAIKAIKEQLRALPQRGIGYGVLRYLADDNCRTTMANLPEARITFNYLGQFDQSLGNDALFKPASEATGNNHDEGAALPNDLSVDSQVVDNQLVLRWTFSRERYDVVTVQKLAESYIAELEQLIAHCVECDASAEGVQVKGVTPSDFPLADLTQSQLDTVTVAPENIEDIYPLTPMQEGLLLHTLLEPGTGIYYMQDRYQINSPIDPQRFAEAWQQVVARHEALRASFSWNAGEAMRQVIHKPGPVEVDFIDWSEEDETEHDNRLQALLKTEREAGFDLLNTPPFHLRLIRLGEARYWFMMSNHHILIDAWCRSILMQDFFEIYTALTEQRAVQLEQPPRYRDYIAWLKQQNMQQALQWWRDNLQGFEQATNIASDRPLLREHAGDSGGMVVGDCYTRLTLDETSGLQQLAQSHQLTLNTFAQAAWALVLRRLSGDRDVLFGVTVAGRPIERPEMQRTVGLFINSIPLRVPMPELGSASTVGDWLQSMLERNLALREYEYMSLVDIQRCSELPQGDPLFDSLFVFENAPVDSAVLESARHFNASSDSGRTHTNFPLTAVCYPGDELGLHISYDQRYFDESTIELMLGQFKRLLLALGESFEQQLSALPLLSDDEQQFLTLTCNQQDSSTTEVVSTGEQFQGYIQRFDANVRAHPERIAASCLDQQWSYQELNDKAERLGQQLQACQSVFKEPVALLAERGLSLLGMIIGTFKAGAAYMPLDPDHPVQRMVDMMYSSRSKVLVCGASVEELAQQVLDQLPCGRRPLLLVWDEVQQGINLHDIDLLSVDLSGQNRPDALSYVIYTSGSTGKPKGVMVEQQGMLNNQLSKVPYLQLTEQDVIAQTASQCFDISVWQFLTAPLFGGRVDIVPNPIAQDPKALLEHVQSQGITVLESVPSLIQGLLDEEIQGKEVLDKGQPSLQQLRWMLPTGEAMPPALANQWLQRYPNIGLVNAYGPAECSDDVALFNIDMDATHDSYLPIGSPTEQNRLYLLDDEISLVPLGATAELCVAGIGVGRGYINDPKRTAQAFIPDPFSTTGERLYRSGDLAKRRNDGLLAYVGRVDQQVKIRGFRIELGEIESRLNRMDSVSEAAVKVQQEETGKHLVAYVTAEGAALDLAEDTLIERLKERLRAELPEYMVPLHWCVMEQMPRNANGKLDRKALPAIDIGQQLREQYVAPSSELEQTLAEIWSELLKVEQVGVHDNFFELGGHSLIATQIASRVQTVLQRNVPLRAMFECSTVSMLAEYIESLDAQELSEEKAERLDDLMSMLEDL